MGQVELEMAKIPVEQRTAAVLTKVEAALPVPPDDLKTIGILAWLLDYFPSRSADGGERERARRLREQLLTPLRKRHPLPLIAEAEWVEIPAGVFLMGSERGDSDERPMHTVTLSSFRMLTHEVTNKEYRRLDSGHGGEDELPAVAISWYKAYAYAAWLGGRLPTEAEWEYAARASCLWEYCDPEGRRSRLDDAGWYGKNSNWALHPVMQLEPNPWGLYDMYGNAWEWVADWYEQPYSSDPQVDPWGPPTGAFRVIRSGSFWDIAWWARAAFRDWWLPGFEDVDLGFRVVIPVASTPEGVAFSGKDWHPDGRLVPALVLGGQGLISNIPGTLSQRSGIQGRDSSTAQSQK